MIKCGCDLELFEKYGIEQTISVDLETKIHWLIAGDSGSGKSYFTLYALRNALQFYSGKAIFYICDFKNDDFTFAAGYEHHYSGAACAEGLTTFYEEFQRVKNGEIKDDKIRILLFDEWVGFQIWATQTESKKQVDLYRGMLLEILLMGRSMNVGCWVIMQRNDAQYLPGREQFFVTTIFGKMSREMKTMVMQGDDLEQRSVYAQGEGIIRVKGMPTRFLKVPRLRSVPRVKEQIVQWLNASAT